MINYKYVEKKSTSSFSFGGSFSSELYSFTNYKAMVFVYFVKVELIVEVSNIKHETLTVARGESKIVLRLQYLAFEPKLF